MRSRKTIPKNWIKKTWSYPTYTVVLCEIKPMGIKPVEQYYIQRKGDWQPTTIQYLNKHKLLEPIDLTLSDQELIEMTWRPN